VLFVILVDLEDGTDKAGIGVVWEILAKRKVNQPRKGR